jgi:O-antigen ligase
MTLILLVFGLAVWGYSALCARTDWYRALCGLIIFDGVVRLFPGNFLNAPGFNLWNVLFLIILVAWIAQRGRLFYGMTRAPRVFLWLGLCLFVFAFVRLLLDMENLVEGLTIAGVLSDFLVNPLKIVIVGLLLFDGCRDRHRLALGLVAILSLSVLLGIQVVGRVLPGVALQGNTMSAYAMRTVLQDVGLHRNDVSVTLAGASWALLAIWPMAVSRKLRAVVVLASAVVMFGVVLTGGRAGYLAWCAVGLTLGLARWRRYVLVIPLAIVLAATLVPGAAERALHGLSDGATIDLEDLDDIDEYELTSGRNLIWPLVIDKISQAPFTGYGLAAMQRTGLSGRLVETEIERGFVRHPHNAYLEMLLDGGLIGLLISTGFYGTCVAAALAFLRDRRSPERAAVGGLALSFVLALLIGSFSGQTLWPRETTLGMWCSIGLLLRVWAQSSWVSADGDNRTRGPGAVAAASTTVSPAPRTILVNGLPLQRRTPQSTGESRSRAAT